MCIYYASSYAGIIAHAKSENGNQFLGDRKILRPLCSVISYYLNYYGYLHNSMPTARVKDATDDVNDDY